MLIVTGDPPRRISDTRNVEVVMQGGRILDRAILRFDHLNDPGFRVIRSQLSGT